MQDGQWLNTWTHFQKRKSFTIMQHNISRKKNTKVWNTDALLTRCESEGIYVLTLTLPQKGKYWPRAYH